MLDLTDLLDMNGMTKEQLAQLCNALYRLLLEHNVNVTIQASPNAGSFGFPPASPFYAPTYAPNNGGLPSGDKMPELPKVWCVNEQGAHNKCVGQVESSQ